MTSSSHPRDRVGDKQRRKKLKQHASSRLLDYRPSLPSLPPHPASGCTARLANTVCHFRPPQNPTLTSLAWKSTAAAGRRSTSSGRVRCCRSRRRPRGRRRAVPERARGRAERKYLGGSGRRGKGRASLKPQRVRKGAICSLFLSW